MDVDFIDNFKKINLINPMRTRDEKAAMNLAISLFFLCGFSTVLNDILIPYLQTGLKLSYTQSSFVQVCFYFGYFIFSPLTGFFCKKSRLIDGILFGLIQGTIGVLLIYFGTGFLLFPLVLFGVFVLGGGIAAIQVAANPFTMQLGSIETASSRLTLAQSFTSVGTVISPYMGALSILTFSFIRITFLYVFVVSLWVALLTKTILIRPKIHAENQEKVQSNTMIFDTFVMLGFIAICLTVGVEVCIGSFLIKFLALPNVGGMTLEAAGKWTVVYWMGFLAGRFLGSFLLKKIHPIKLLHGHAIAGVAVVLLGVLSQGYFSAFCILSLGYCTSILFPVIFSLVLSGCKGQKTAVSGFLCMANIGGALLPFLQGFLADRIGLHHSFIVPCLGYLYFVFYARYLQTSHPLDSLNTEQVQSLF